MWRYANNGVISSDGQFQLSGVDRTRYLVRFGGRLVLIAAENFSIGEKSFADIDLSHSMEWITETGGEAVTDDERESIRRFLDEALPLMGRQPNFN